jgi:hypothetical protein
MYHPRVTGSVRIAKGLTVIFIKPQIALKSKPIQQFQATAGTSGGLPTTARITEPGAAVCEELTRGKRAL